MENIKIKIESDLINYNLEFSHRLNIIEGYSATGKSTLLRILDGDENSGSSIISNYNILHVNNKTLEQMSELKDDIVYILDESDGINKDSVISKINLNKYKFIIITREMNLSQISYGIDQIYEIYNSGKYNISREKYKDKLNKKVINKSKLNEIITEDSKSGYEFYKMYDNFRVKSVNGNSNINENIRDNQIIVIDSVGYGPYIKELKEKVDITNNILIYPNSFEWLILTSDIFRKNSEELEKEYYKSKLYINRENFYLKILKNKSMKKNINYFKSKLNNKFLEKAQFNKINDRIAELFNIDISDLNKNLNNEIKMGWE